MLFTDGACTLTRIAALASPPQLDVGTQGCKVLAYCTATCAVVGRGSASYPLAHPRPGAAEQDPELWLAGLERAISAALAGLDASRVAAVAVSGQQHGLVVVDASGKVRCKRPSRLLLRLAARPARARVYRGA